MDQIPSAIDVLTKLQNDLSPLDDRNVSKMTFEPRLFTFGENNHRKIQSCSSFDQANCINLITHHDQEMKLSELCQSIEQTITLIKKLEPKKLYLIECSCLVWQVVREIDPESLYTKYFHTFDELVGSIISQICKSDPIETDPIESHLDKMFSIYGSFFEPSFQLKILYSRFAKTLTYFHKDDHRSILLNESKYIVYTCD